MSQITVQGIFVGVVGPSGAGKDSVLRAAASALTGDHTVHFTRRIVTRTSSADEDHECVSDGEFSALIEAGALALYWGANGLRYGIPQSINDRLAQGHIVIANASREIAPQIKKAFARSIIVHITASEENLRKRLQARNREPLDSIELRLVRSKELEQKFDADIRIENNGELQEAADYFVAAIRALKPSIRLTQLHA